MAPKVLVVLTSQDKIEKTGGPTGWYLPEFSHPHKVLAGKVELDVASPKGGVAPLDPGSVELWKEDATSTDFLRDHASLWEQTKPISSFLGKSSDYVGLFYPGGHGPMFDLVNDKDSIALIKEFYEAGKPVAAVCHGPAVLLNVEIDGKPILAGREATGFSNVEEEAVKMTDAMPFLLEDEIRKRGATYVKHAEPWGSKVVGDGKIITGQNPNSATAVGEALLAALKL